MQAVDEGFPVTHNEVLGNILAIYGGAQLATATSIGVMLMNLVANPDQFQLVREDPTLIPEAVDESLRVHQAGLFGFPRYAFEDTEVGGTKIWKNMAIMVGIASANLDPTKFEEPNWALPGSAETGLVGFLFSISRRFSDPTVVVGPPRIRLGARLRVRCGGVRC